MTREEFEQYAKENGLVVWSKEMSDKAIKALEQEPTTKNDLAVDCISREQALRELKESAEHHANNSREEMLLRRDRDIIRALPSVTPQEPTDNDVVLTYDMYHDLIADRAGKLEQELVLDKIKAELTEKRDSLAKEVKAGVINPLSCYGLDYALLIIDKAESEGKE